MSADYKLYVVIEKDGKPRSARIALRDFRDAKRVMAAAAILAGEPISMCVRVETSDGGVFADVLPSSRTKADLNVVERTVRYCRRSITGPEITAHLRPRKAKAKAPASDLFGALA